MELTVIFQGDDDSEELIYSGGTRKTWSWLPSKARGLFCRDEHQDEEEESTWKKAGFIPQKGLGTPIPFRVITGTDVIMRNGVTQNVATKLHAITEMSCYTGAERSFDELRFEDYCCWKAAQDKNKVVSNQIDNSVFHLNQSNASSCIASSCPLPPSAMTQAVTDSRRNSGVQPTSDLLISSTGNFSSEGDRDFVFNPQKPCPEDSCVGKEPLSSVTSKLQLRDTLVQNIVRCRKIQNSLYRLVLLKLQSHATGVTRDHTDSSYKENSASKTERSVANENNTAGDPSMEDLTGTVHGASEVPSTESEAEGLNDSLVCPSEKNEVENADYAATDVVGAELNINNAPEVSTMESKVDPSGESDVSKAANENSSSVQENEEDSVHDVPSTQGSSSASSPGNVSSDKSQVSRLCRRAFLCALKEPLDTLVRCTEIQRSLFHNLTMVNNTSSEEAVLISQRKRLSCLNNIEELNCKEFADFLLVKSKFEERTLINKNKMDCTYARNPFSNKQPRRATNEDILQGRNVRPSILAGSNEFTDNWFWRDIPHGSGSLKTPSGEPIYSGDWCEGKRHGKGKGVIFSLSTVGQFAAEHGVYSGEWKRNMRHGRGNMMFFSGAVYDGQWKFDKVTGYGTLKLPDGSIQEGTWRDGKLHGCAVFTWPHGVSEYREYDATRGQLSSCTREKQTTNSMAQMVSIYPQLLNLQETLSELIRERHFLRKDVAALKKENAEMITKAQIHTFEFRKRYQEQMVTSYEKERNDAEKALKAATEELKKELEETKAALVCQICFLRPRDCILLPCSHLLYCRVCVREHRENGDSRCPTCRGTINSEILCNLNHPL
ncbi:uncharacterized protein [Acropora muricata]